MTPTLPRRLPFGVRHVSGDRIVAMQVDGFLPACIEVPPMGRGVRPKPK